MLLYEGISASSWLPYINCEYCNAATRRASTPNRYEVLPCRIIAQ